jgi:sec-independent protein translocase protein TatA
MNTYMLAMLGWTEIAVIVFVVLLLFGAKKLPELARGMGKGIREFKRASSDIQHELESSQYEEEKPRERRRKEKPAEATDAAEAKGEAKESKAESSTESKA